MSDKPVSDEQAFESIKSGVDALPPGVKMMLNSCELILPCIVHVPASLLITTTAEFYGQGFSVGNLELLARFYEKYPDYVDKTFLAVKVRVPPPRGSPADN